MNLERCGGSLVLYINTRKKKSIGHFLCVSMTVKQSAKVLNLECTPWHRTHPVISKKCDAITVTIRQRQS